MLFNYPEGRKPEPTPEVEVGNVYSSKNTLKTKAWIVLNINGNTVHLLGIDAEGEVSSTQSYSMHSVERRTMIGKVNLSALEFDIEPTP